MSMVSGNSQHGEKIFYFATGRQPNNWPQLQRFSLLNLTRDQLTDDGILTRLGKTGKALLIEYTPDLLAVLDRAKKVKPQLPAPNVLRTRNGKAYTASGFASAWKRLLRKAIAKKKITESFTFHDLRAK